MNTRKLRAIFAILVALFACPPAIASLTNVSTASAQSSAPIIIDHHATDLSDIPESWINEAKNTLHIAYGHTSHGSQLVDGMTGLVTFAGSLYEWNNGGTGGALDLRDQPFSGASDLGNPNRTAWATATRNYLDANPDINVIIWSWCGQAGTATEADIDTYLSLMNQLEIDYPNVQFVYMTGHLDGSGVDGNLNQRNEQIRTYARENNKILYDFADIESYDPDGLVNYMELDATDGCYYDADGDGSLESNWAIDWQNSHTVGEDWYQCGSAHSQPLNANMKAYAAWTLWARLAGWSGQSGTSPTIAGCDVFPWDHIWNAPIDTMPIDTNSTAYINTIGASTGIKADFGSGTWEGFPIGIPYIDVPGTQPKVDVIFDLYGDESDPGPYPVPDDPPIEGDPNGDGDRHVLIVDRDDCVLYELGGVHQEADGWHAGAGAIFDLNDYYLRPETWTSADAAGLPILPGLVRYDEIATGEIRHAIRFTAEETRHAYVWPARHYASSLTGTQYPPMGQRFRLKAGYDISGFSPEVQVILQAMKTYGLILADNGSNWFISGAPDERWDNDMLRELLSVDGSNFEAVDASSLMIDVDSGQAQVGDTPSSAPTLISPADGLATTDTTPTFDWVDVAGATQYEIQVADNAGFSSPTIDDDTLTASTYTPPSALADGTYYWRVRANSGGWSDYSNEWVVTVQTASGECPSTSSRSYSAGVVLQYDLDDPVRPAWNHADKNLALRYYSLTSALEDFVVYGAGDPTQPPQFATLFSPDRVPAFSSVYRVNDWIWAPSPEPGTRGAPLTNYPVTLLGLETVPGEELQSPTHARNLGAPWGTGGAVVMFADEDSITLKFTREDSAGTGYTVHIDNICTDPNLLSLYNTLDDADRNSIYDPAYGNNIPRDGTVDYSLPGLSMGQVFGTARDTEIRVAIVDTGMFLDPRSRDEWWQIRPAVGAATPGSPVDGETVDSAPVTYSWDAVTGAAQYRLYVVNNTAGTLIHDAVHTAEDLGCPGGIGICSVAPAATYTYGDYTWYLQTSNSYSDGPWSGPANFTFNDGTGPPGAATPASPNDETVTSTPVNYSWSAVTWATQYRLYVVNNTAGTLVHDGIHSAADLGCSGGGTCSVAPTATYTNGSYTWYLQASNSYGDGPWSGPAGFTFSCPTCVPPGAATPGSPIGGTAVTSAPVTYTWDAVTGATQYRLYVVNNTTATLVHDVVHTATDLGCSGGGTCSIAPSASYTNGSHTWYLQSSNSYGNGSWSDPATCTFDDGTGPPGAATPGSPVGGMTVTSTPVTYSWPAVAGATQYRLYVVNNTAAVLVHDAIHAATDLGCSGGGTCSAVPSATYTNGSYTWYLQASNSYGDGPWSSGANFTFNDGAGPPGAATPGSPGGGMTVTSAPVTYSWPAVAGATQYRLYVVNNTAAVLIHDGMHTATDLGCSGSGTCSVAPSASYTNGSYTWYLQAGNSYGDGPWSGPASFTFDNGTSPPGAATPGSPIGGETVTSAPVIYSWPAVAGATQYRLYVVNDTAGVLIHDGTHTATDLGCSGGGICSVVPSASYTNGSCTWYLQASNSYGDGPWSGPASFTFDDGTSPPGAATPGSPIGGETVTSAPVTYSWPAVAGATQYRLYVVNDTAGVLIHDGVHTATDLGCWGGGTCSVAPSASYTNGSCTWYLQASNSYGNGPWSSPANFTFDDGTSPPGAAAPGSPIGGETVTSTPVTYSWPAVAGAAQYRLYVVNDTAGVLIHDGVHTVTDLGCSGGGTCSVAPSASYTNSSCTWYLQASNSYGNGPWSSPANFTFNCPTCAPPGTTTLLAPTDGSTVTSAPVTFSWSAATGATQYRLYVNGPAGTAVHDGMHDAATVCDIDTCSVTPSITYTDGSYNWWIQPGNSYGEGPWAGNLTFAFSSLAFSLLPDTRQMHLVIDIPFGIVWVGMNERT